jgi:hypothetical protein
MYDVDYYYNMLKMYAKSGEQIAKIRWDFIGEYILPSSRILDFGSGLGFFAAHAPEEINVDTCDVGPYVTTGIRHDRYDVLCLWDVLEHLPDFSCIHEHLCKVQFVAITVPMLPEGKELLTWKHFKPNEHLHYFTNHTLDALFKVYGFTRVKDGYPECPPREDIISVVYRREIEN